jgi:hypothetical protein
MLPLPRWPVLLTPRRYVFCRGPNIYVYTSTNVTDSEGRHPPVILLNPPMEVQISSYGLQPRTVEVSIFGCTLLPSNQLALLDAGTNKILALEKPSWKTSSSWENWTPAPSKAGAELVNVGID